MTIETWKYDDFLRLNCRKVSEIDFINSVYVASKLPEDFALCIGHLFVPRLVMVDGVIFANEWFSEERYKDYRSRGVGSAEAQAWINLIEVTGIFEGISFEKAKDLAATLAVAWDARIEKLFPDEATRATVIVEEELGEVYVTIGRFETAHEKRQQ